MSLSDNAVRRCCVALGSQDAGNELATAINNGAAGASQDAYCVPALIVATNVSQTIDFGALAVGDKVIHIPTVAGSAQFLSIATAGTLGVAAVVGDLYLVLRAFAAPAATAFSF